MQKGTPFVVIECENVYALWYMTIAIVLLLLCDCVVTLECLDPCYIRVKAITLIML